MGDGVWCFEVEVCYVGDIIFVGLVENGYCVVGRLELFEQWGIGWGVFVFDFVGCGDWEDVDFYWLVYCVLDGGLEFGLVVQEELDFCGFFDGEFVHDWSVDWIIGVDVQGVKGEGFIYVVWCFGGCGGYGGYLGDGVFQDDFIWVEMDDLGL